MTLDEFNQQTAQLKPSGDGSGMDAINDWWKSGHQLFRQDQQAFNQWSQDNPEMAIRWHARAANDDVNTDWDSKQHHQMAQAISLGHGQQLGMGNDMKKDGKMLAFDYDTFKDVNNEWGEGDFWKIGTSQTLDKGLGAFIDNLDLKDVAMMAAPFIAGPLIGPMLASMGIPAGSAASSILSGSIMEGIQGGDLKDIAMGGFEGWVANGGLSGIEMPDIGVGDFEGFELPDWMKGAGDVLGDIGDIFGGTGEMGEGFELPGFIGDIAGGLWKGTDWNPQAAQGQPQMVAQAPPPEPTELAKMFATPRLSGPTPMGPYMNPTGMFA